MSVRKHHAENPNVYAIHEDSSTELTPQSRKKTISYGTDYHGAVYMALQRTLSMIKPDAVAKNVIGEIYARFEKAGLQIVAAKMQHLNVEQAAEFYAVHKERPFYQELIDLMTSGPVMIQVLEGENAIAVNRELMGATFPKDAEAGTIRADFCDADGDQGENAVHGSDAPETAATEIPFFFSAEELCTRTR